LCVKYVNAKRIVKSLFAALALLAVALRAGAAPSGEAPPAREKTFLPADWNVALRVARAKVAAGGIADAAHQTTWEIEVRDAEGRPQRDVPLELPVATPQVVWKLEALRAPANAPLVTWKIGETGLTGKDGIARGVFTSGRIIETIVLQAKVFADGGGPQAEIKQVWNELSAKETNEGDEKHHNNEKPNKVRNTMKFHDGDRSVPITGHRLEMRPTSVALVIMGEGDRDNEEITVPANPDNPDWKAFSSWSQFGEFTEVKPGIYEGAIVYHCPPLPPPGQAVKGVRYIVAVGRISYGIADLTVFLPSK